MLKVIYFNYLNRMEIIYIYFNLQESSKSQKPKKVIS